MSLLDKASLIVTPNAYKESKLYSVVPSSGAGDMDVVRATTATRVNSAGLIEVVPRNLITYSEQINNADWVKTNVTITANATNAPNGTLTAEKLIPTVTNDLHITESSVVPFISGNSYTFSFYAKRAENNFIQITASSSLLSTRANFNLLNGTLGTVDSGITATITLIDNDWYRCTASFVASATGNFRMILSNITASTSARFATFAGNGTSGVFVWGCQIDNGSTATEYFPTTTRLNIPRIDYTNGSCPSLLVEPQRTNVLLYSQNFNGVSWTPVATTITANAGISPDGTNNANKFIPSTLATSHYIAQFFISSTNGSISIYAKADGYNNITLLTSNTNVNYNLSTGTVQDVGGVGTGAIQSVGNGWYRCILYKVLTTETLYISCGSNTNAGFFNGSGNGTSGVLIWGAQVEAGAYPTSYIPTLGASSVTRNADVISKTGISSLIGQTEGTMFLDLVFPQNEIASYIGISDGTTSNRIIFGAESGTFYTFGYATQTFGLSLNTRYKIALAYNSTNMLVYINGVLSSTIFGTVPSGMNRFGFNNGGSGQNFIGTINSAQLYKTKLSNTELAQLTTL